MVLSATAALLWIGLLLVPWRPWLAGPQLQPDASDPRDLVEVTALIPARNEAPVIERTLGALQQQGTGLRVVVVDDQSSDDTADRVRNLGRDNVLLIAGRALPAGWTGKLWALEQGRGRVETSLTLLLDADIELQPGVVGALLTKLRGEGLQLASVLALPDTSGFWSALLMPAYVYFFLLLYPFRLSNTSGSRVAAAAGGCILVESAVLRGLGGFGALRDALIDDCTLARQVKAGGGRTWMGLSSAVLSRRVASLADIWRAVTRTAYTQLRYSPAALLICTALLLLAFWIPALAQFAAAPAARIAGAVAFVAMLASYVPALRHCRRSALWSMTLPVTATLYLAMTWHSAWRYWRGERGRWKDRSYAATGDRGVAVCVAPPSGAAGNGMRNASSVCAAGGTPEAQPPITEDEAR